MDIHHYFDIFFEGIKWYVKVDMPKKTSFPNFSWFVVWFAELCLIICILSLHRLQFTLLKRNIYARQINATFFSPPLTLIRPFTTPPKNNKDNRLDNWFGSLLKLCNYASLQFSCSLKKIGRNGYWPKWHWPKWHWPKWLLAQMAIGPNGISQNGSWPKWHWPKWVLAWMALA